MKTNDGLCEALDQMLLAVRSGRFKELAEVTRQIEEAAAQLSGTGHASLEVIRRKAGMNSLCLAAALRGVRAARRRIAEIGDIQNGRVTYDSHGRRDETASLPGQLVERF